MAKTRYPSYPACCQKILEALEHENRRGTRNCEKGHQVSVEQALAYEAANAKKAAAAAAAAAANPTPVSE
jgi:hypothetical protein